MIPLNYHHLYYFHAIAREGSMAKAAAALFLAQPTLSAQLKSLETALKRKLFERGGRKLTLTEDGRVVLRYAEAIFRMGRELEDDLRDRPPGGLLTAQFGVVLGTPPTAIESLVSAALAAGAAHVDCREAALPDLLEDLCEHRIDLLFSDRCDATHGDPDRRWRRVASLPVVFAASPALAKKRPRLPGGLGGVPLILPKAPADVYRQVQTYLAESGVPVRVSAEVPDVETARRLALSGAGVSPLNSLTLERSRPAGALVPLPGAPTGLRHELWLATAARRLRPNPVAERLFASFRLGQKR
ncbi:MAG: LysR family transcriptional regulator [Elusimicrobia bacterium]|nr:LysR family transcriptional regulator [Elusimicrobiota bacterium]